MNSVEDLDVFKLSHELAVKKRTTSTLIVRHDHEPRTRLLRFISTIACRTPGYPVL